MGRPKQLSDEEILKVAKDCFVRQGPGVSTTVIAKKAGVSQAVLFKRFGTKEELTLRALMPQGRPMWADQIEKGPEPNSADLRSQLLQVVHKLWLFIQETMPCMSALRASGVPIDNYLKRFKPPPPVRGQRALAQWFRIANQQGWARISNPDHLALILSGALHGRSFYKHVLGQKFTKKDDEAYLESVTDLLWNTIAPKDNS